MKSCSDDQSFNVLDLDSSWLTMDPAYFAQSSAPYIWTYDSSVDLQDEHFSSDGTIPSGYNPPCADIWSIQDYQQGSSPSSEQSLMSRAPSTNTSYNEIDNVDSFLEPSSSERPIFDIRTQSPVSFPVTAPELLFGLQGSASDAACKLPATVEQYVCQEGCSRKTFGRPYELDRHIREQHRCPHEDCVDVRFSRPKEKREHERQHSETGLGYRCGTCVLSGHQPKTLTRGEKLKKHFKDTHDVDDEFDFRNYQCMREICYVSKKFGGIFFASKRELKEHEKQEHSIVSAGIPLNERAAKAYASPLYDHCTLSSGEKRPLNAISCSEAKRGKTQRIDSSMATPTGQMDLALCSGKDLIPPMELNPQSYMQPANATNSDSRSHFAARSETFPLSVIELHALTKHESWSQLIEDLQELSISPVFDSKEGAIKLRGSSSPQFDKGKKLVEQLIDSVQVKATAQTQGDALDAQRLKQVSHQRTSVRPQPEIYALDVKENADVLALWNKRLLPSFPFIVRQASIKGSYSVSLVRQKIAEGLCPIIRFRSSGNQSEASRRTIRESVTAICVENGCPKIHVQFTEGTLVRLVGGNGNKFEDAVPDDPSYDQRFPHERRPWHTPGLSASIGLSDCAHVSATLGGYISVDNRIYMLTVDHFINECCSVSTQVRSPSKSDVRDVSKQLERKIAELSHNILQAAPDEIPLGQVEGYMFVGDVDEELELYKRFKRELEAEDSQFNLAMVRERCGGSQPLFRLSGNPNLPVPGASHRMDWSLSEVTARHRMGKNVLRYGRVNEPTLGHLQAEMSRTGGLGDLCASTRDVVVGEKAYYVGTTSGLREGFVNPAMTLYEDEHGNLTHEWALVVPGCERLGDRDFQGDSGAWIISNDEKLLGLLWGWDNGNLLFTPIHDIFADIAQKMRVSLQFIKLPEISTPRSRQGSLLCRRSHGALRDVSPHMSDQPTELPAVAPELLSPASIVEKRSRRRSSGAYSTCSETSTPSLLSSASSFVGDLGLEDISTNLPATPPSSSNEEVPNIDRLPLRPKARAASRIEAIEDWVCIPYDDDPIEDKFSALRLAGETTPYNMA